jgi:hypothetical protein
MKRFVEAVHASVASKNWYGSLALAITLPDVCGRLEFPAVGSGQRYKDWWDKYVLPKYNTMLYGTDVYALRCSYLHEGTDDTLNQRASAALTKFVFIIPPPGGGRIHCNKSDFTLQLQVDIFCSDICDGVTQWMTDVQNVQQRMSALLSIKDIRFGLSF